MSTSRTALRYPQPVTRLGISIHSATMFFAGLCLALAGPANPLAAQAVTPLTSPKQQFGFNLGDDYCLANYQQLMAYWSKLERESDRLKVVRIGVTEEGRPQLMGIVTSPANHRALARYQEIARRLALAEGVSEAEARQLSDAGKAVVWIDGGLHANETLCAQMLMETMYQLLRDSDAETLRILDDLIILLVHANPDGMDLVADWYMREQDPKRRTLAGLPRLYQKYIGHDNNRDFYANTQAETRNMNRVLYFDWFPQIVYNHHQSGPPGSILFCPPFRDPFNYCIDPLVINGIDAVGAAMMQRFLVEGKPGATVRSGARFSTWFNGGLRTTTYFHNMIGLLTETVGNPTPMQIPFNPTLQLPRADYLAPIAPQRWHFRQSVDYSVTANKAVFDYASRHRQQLLQNIWLMGKTAIDRGNRDSWTVTPKVVDAAREARRNAPTNRGGAEEFKRLFRDPARRDPRGYILPATQPDFLTAIKFANTLIETGVKVQRAKTGFAVAGKSYPAGSVVIKCAQPFRAHILDLFEPQDHPNDFPYPGAPPTAPYDLAGWTLAFQMGVKFDRILDGFDGPFEEVQGRISPPPGIVVDADSAAGFFLDCRTNDSFRAVNVLLAAKEEVSRLREPIGAQPPGTFWIGRTPSTLPLIKRLAADLGVSFQGSQVAPGSQAIRLQPVRIGLWDRYGGSMPSGWTRWLLERFEFPFRLVFPQELDQGNLREKFDAIILVDGAIAGRDLASVRSGTFGGEQPLQDQRVPEEYRDRRGSITVKNTLPQLQKFLESGGTILALGSSTSLGQQLGLPVADHLVSKEAAGKERPLSREKFYVPGSVLRLRVDPSQPLAWGLGEEVDVMFAASPTFRLARDAESTGLSRVAWFDSKMPLRSGWAWGQEHLEGGSAIVDARVGKGRLVLFGPHILFRGQPHGTFKFFFNGIAQAGQPVSRPGAGVSGSP